MSADIAENLWSLVCSCLNTYLAFHLFPFLIFFKFLPFCTEFNLFTSICFFLFIIMDFPYICYHQVGYSAVGYSLSPRLFLTWYIYPYFQDWLHWWVLILHKTYDDWSVVVLTVTTHFIYSYFWLFFKLVAFCTEFKLFTEICFLPFMIIDFIHICDHPACYSPGGYLLYPRWFLTWYIYPFFLDWLHWWVVILDKTYDHWSLALWTVTEDFIYSHLWFFSDWLLSSLNSICLHPFVLFSLSQWISPISVITKWANLLADIYCIRGGSWLGISINFFSTGCTDECWSCTKPMITGL